MKILAFAGLLLLAGELSMSGWAAEQAPPEAVDKASVVRGNTEFSLSLYAQLRSQDGNLFFSPWSLSTALAMTYAGRSCQIVCKEKQAVVLLDDDYLLQVNSSNNALASCKSLVSNPSVNQP